MSTSTAPRRKSVTVVLVGLALIAILMMLASWPQPEASQPQGTSSSNKVVGEAVGYTKGQTDAQVMAAIETRLKLQPTKEAMLNMLAQEACLLDAELYRLHPHESYSIYDEPLLVRSNKIAQRYYQLAPGNGEANAIETRQDKYCRGKHPVG